MAGRRDPENDGSGLPWREVGKIFLQLLGASWWWIAGPILGTLGREPEFLAGHGLGTQELLAFVALALLGPPTLALLVAVLGPRWLREALISGFLAISAVVVLLGSTRSFLPPTLWLIAGVVGLAVSLRLARHPRFRDFFAILGLTSPVLAVLFLSRSLEGTAAAPAPTPGPSAIRSESDSETPVVLLLFDELPLTTLLDSSLQVDEELFPAFASLASESTWFRNATTVAQATNDSVPAILTGDPPAEGLVASYASHPLNLMTLLESRGYGVWVSESLRGYLSPSSRKSRPRRRVDWRALIEDLCILYPHTFLHERWRRALPDISSTQRGFGRAAGEDTRFRPQVSLEEFEESLEQADRGRNLWAYHYMLPHVPWRFTPDGREYDVLDWMVSPCFIPGTGGLWCDDADLTEHALRRHFLQTGYTDRVLGESIAALKRAQRWDSALVVVTADHGCAFLPSKPRRGHLPETAAQVLNVPLFVKYPGQRVGEIREDFVQTIDVLPTVLDLLGMDGVSTSGRSLRSQEPRSGPRVWMGKRGQREYREIDVEAVDASRRWTAARNQLLREAGGWADVWRGDLPLEVDGRRVEELDRERVEIRGTVSLSSEGSFAGIRSDEAFRPSLIHGAIEDFAVDASDYRLVVSVNDRISAQAVLRVLDGSRVEFLALVPPDRFDSGDNRVEVHVLVPKAVDGGFALAGRFEGGEVGLRLTQEEGGLEAIVDRGARHPVRPSAGGTYYLERTFGGLWSVRAKRRKLPGAKLQSLAVFSRGRLVAQCSEARCRVPWNVAEATAEVEKPRVFVVTDRGAFELRRVAAPAWPRRARRSQAE